MRHAIIDYRAARLTGAVQCLTGPITPAEARPSRMSCTAIPRDSADRKATSKSVKAMVARVLAEGSSLLLTDARCADATCTFTFDFTDFSRLRISIAASRVNAPRAARRIRVRSAPGPEAGEQE